MSANHFSNLTNFFSTRYAFHKYILDNKNDKCIDSNCQRRVNDDIFSQGEKLPHTRARPMDLSVDLCSHAHHNQFNYYQPYNQLYNQMYLFPSFYLMNEICSSK